MKIASGGMRIRFFAMGALIIRTPKTAVQTIEMKYRACRGRKLYLLMFDQVSLLGNFPPDDERIVELDE